MPDKEKTQEEIDFIEAKANGMVEYIVKEPLDKNNIDLCLSRAQMYVQSVGDLKKKDDASYLALIALMNDEKNRMPAMSLEYIKIGILGILTDECSSCFIVGSGAGTRGFCSVELINTRWEKMLRLLDPLVKRYYKSGWKDICPQLMQPLFIGVQNREDWVFEDTIFGEWGMDLRTLKKIIGSRGYLSYTAMLGLKFADLKDIGQEPGEWYRKFLEEARQQQV